MHSRMMIGKFAKYVSIKIWKCCAPHYAIAPNTVMQLLQIRLSNAEIVAKHSSQDLKVFVNNSPKALNDC